MKASDRQVGGNHYKEIPIEPSYFCQVNGLGWCESNAIKYSCRHRRKNGRQDIEKAIHYLELLLEWEYPETPDSKATCSTCLDNDICRVFAKDPIFSVPCDRYRGNTEKLSDLYLHGNLCATCRRLDTECHGDYPATRDGGCEGYIKAERKASLCHSCHAVICSKEFIADCEESGICDRYAPALRERMLDAASPCDTCATFPCDDLGGKAVKCSNWKEKVAEAKQDAPKTDEPAPAHTDPAVNCKDCATLTCPRQSHNVTLDQGCDGFKPWDADLTLPSIALDCTANAAWLKYLEECREVEKAKTVLHSLIELWDCIQAVQTCIEKGGDKHDLYNGLIADMEKRRREGNQVDLARRAMLVKNAARWRYSDKVNRLIIESNGHCFKEADA